MEPGKEATLVSPPTDLDACPHPDIVTISAVGDRLLETVACEPVALSPIHFVLVEPAKGTSTDLGRTTAYLRGATYGDVIGRVLIWGGSGWCDSVVRLDPAGTFEPVPLVLDGKVKRLNKQVDDTCDADAILEVPALESPEKMLAFGTTGIVGLSLEGRRSASRALLRVDVMTGEAQRIAVGFMVPRSISLDRNHQRAYVSAGRDGVDAVWRVDLSSGVVREIVRGQFSSIAISPEGTLLATVSDESEREVSIHPISE